MFLNKLLILHFVIALSVQFVLFVVDDTSVFRDCSVLLEDCIMMPAVLINVSTGSTVNILTVAGQKHREATLLSEEDELI